ncbi:hypothetical protein [Shewanella sp. TC10]|uniref:hypothetical protein n=1 Tax=Shewanella sp. TC10 TaxID=1419739 RepID=UPI00129E122F|nr:hypothetical protein [Shewanella sp. TC10]
MFELLLVILTFASPILIAIFISKYFKYKSEVNAQLQELQNELGSKANHELQNEVKDLKERLASVETIVTDSGYELNQKIANLK